MNCADNYLTIKNALPENVTLLAVSKTKPQDDILKLYNLGQRDFGENKVQELNTKYECLPKDIRWHMIGHLQTNKVKYIVPYIYLIHSIDSLKLLEEVNKIAQKNQKIVNCLLQLKVANEDTKFGFSRGDLIKIFKEKQIDSLKNVAIKGLMAMATNTDNEEEIRKEFQEVQQVFYEIKRNYLSNNQEFKEISMGMSGDYKIALENGSTIVRLGSIIFGARDYSNKQQ